MEHPPFYIAGPCVAAPERCACRKAAGRACPAPTFYAGERFTSPRGVFRCHRRARSGQDRSLQTTRYRCIAGREARLSKKVSHPLAPSARGLRPQAVGERTVRLPEIFLAMARFSPSAPSGHRSPSGASATSPVSGESVSQREVFRHAALPLTREAFPFWHIFSSFLRFWNIFRLFCTNRLLLRFLLYYNDKVFENVHFYRAFAPLVIIGEVMSDKEKILIADDSAMNRAILTEMLGDGYEILEAENGRQAVAILQSATDIDLLLLDIMMPEMDGFEVLAMMNKYHWIDEVPVIMISAENASSYVERAYDLGATDYISRPFDMVVVRRRVINTLMLYAKQKRLVRLVAEQVYEKEKSNSTMINILSHIVEFRNGESGMHVLHIQTATDILLHTLVQKTDKYHLTAADISLISTASALHDIGKINIPESILNKPGRLTKEEFEVMKTHTTIGSEILEKLPFQQESDLVKTAYAICRWHHERWDGRGYPDGLKGEQIPIAAQVVSLADVYDALTSERCYKKAFDHDTAVKMILNGECGQFNPLLLECLTECGAQLHAELSIASDTGSQLHRLADAQHISDALLRENALPGQNHIVQSLSRMQQKGRFFNQSVRCIQFDYDEPTGHLSFSAWAAEHMGVPKDLHLPDEVEETGFALADIARIQKALRATSAEHPYTELSMLLPIDGELRWHHVRLCSLWSDDSVPAYIGAAGQADPAEQFFDYHHDLYHDVLTNAYNRRFFEKQLRKLMEVDAIAMLDLDQFKQINDVYGHQAGDDALRMLVSAVTACVRNRSDALVRYGGDEFLLIFPHIPEHVFIKRLEQIRATVQALHMIEYPDLHLTVSIGGVYGACTLDPGIRQADKLLYQAKESRNKCITAAFSAEEAEEPKPNQESDKL